MSSCSTRFAGSLAGLFAACILPAAAFAGDAPAPHYTYVGAAYEWPDSKCAYEPDGTSLQGYTVEGSVGVFKWGHLLASYFDGETGGRPDQAKDVISDPNASVDGKCYEVGGGLNYTFAPGADVVLRGYWVDVDIDDLDISETGFEPELGVRYAFSEQAEVDVSLAYYDLNDDLNKTQLRVNLFYNVLPWLAVRIGGNVFNSDSSLVLGVRANFGGNLF
jgi:hypothetical protein